MHIPSLPKSGVSTPITLLLTLPPAKKPRLLSSTVHSCKFRDDISRIDSSVQTTKSNKTKKEPPMIRSQSSAVLHRMETFEAIQVIPCIVFFYCHFRTLGDSKLCFMIPSREIKMKFHSEIALFWSSIWLHSRVPFRSMTIEEGA